MPFLKEQCSGLAPGQSYGFYSGEGSYRLDSPEGCGLLSGGPEVVTLSGNPVARLTAQDYAGLQRNCELEKFIVFGLSDGSEIDVPCPAALENAATRLEVTSFPDLPVFRPRGV